MFQIYVPVYQKMVRLKFIAKTLYSFLPQHLLRMYLIMVFFSLLLIIGVQFEGDKYHTNNCQFYQAPLVVQKMTDDIVGNMRESALYN